MSRYTVWWSTGRRDGDSGYDTLRDAEIAFADKVARTDVAEVEIIDNADPDNPKTIKRHPQR